MVPESEFLHARARKHRVSRKLLKNYTLTELPQKASEGRYQKGQGLRKRTRVKQRPPIMGDAISQRPEDVIWLRVGRS
jgi:hypothetical protein